MDHFRTIYSHRATDYHRMITPEDVDGNVLRALREVWNWRGKRLLDLGTGTGRIPLLLAREGVRAVGLDLHADMLRENAEQRNAVSGDWLLAQDDMRTLPFADHWADAVSAGWAIGHSRGWFAEEWQTQIGRMLREMERVIAPGGWLIIFETLGTGSPTPAPPNAELAEYYAWLEIEWASRATPCAPTINSRASRRPCNQPDSSSARNWRRRFGPMAGHVCPSGRGCGQNQFSNNGPFENWRIGYCFALPPGVFAIPTSRNSSTYGSHVSGSSFSLRAK